MTRHTHAVMFHHFHSDVLPASQGSISGETFADMLDWLSERYVVRSAEEYLHALERGRLQAEDICLTFDDALLCQFEIAAPILRRRGLQAFFFIYSSPFRGIPSMLEVYRLFRMTSFADIGAFYAEYDDMAQSLLPDKYGIAEETYDSGAFMNAYPFYSPADKWFRYLRDEVLDEAEYDGVMSAMMGKHGFRPMDATRKLWMSDADLRALKSDGHMVGLHSFSHPTTLHKLSPERQALEYRQNMEHIRDAIGQAPVSMSHPCGQYNDETLTILRRIGIRIGFRSNMAVANIRSPLEIPRQDHANIVVEMSR